MTRYVLFMNNVGSVNSTDISGNIPKIGKIPIYRRNIADNCRKIPKFPLNDISEGYIVSILTDTRNIAEILADISEILNTDVN